MKRMILKFVKITFEYGVIKQFGGYDNIDHIETDMLCGGKIFRIQVVHNKLDNELQHIEIYKFDVNTIVSIDQRWL